MSRNQFAERVLITVIVSSTVILLLLFLGHIFPVLLIVTAAVLVAVFFDSIARWLYLRIPLSLGWCKALSALGVILLIGGSVWALAPRVSQQATELQQQLPNSVDQAKQQLRQTSWGGPLISYVEQQDVKKQLSSNANKFFSAVFGVFGALADIYIILFMGLLIYASPDPYLSGIIHLVPKSKRDRADTVLKTLGQTLRSWLAGQLLSMLIVAVLTWLGLWIVGLPFALVLGLTAGLLAFVPNFGPLISLLLGLVVAATVGLQTILWTAAIYIGVQILESNFLTPIIQKKKVSLPMAMVLFAQLVFGTFAGALGLVLATPIFALVMMLVKMLYVEDTLDDHSFQLEPQKHVNKK